MKVSLSKLNNKTVMKILDGYRAGEFIESTEGVAQTFTDEAQATEWAYNTGYELIKEEVMNKFSAGEAFYNLMIAHPDDFTATIDSGREHHVYRIRNKYRDVSVNLDVHDNEPKVVPSSSAHIIYILDSTMTKMISWAIQRIEDDKVRARIEADDEAIKELLIFYKNK